MLHPHADVAREAVAAATAELIRGRGGAPLARTAKGSKDFLTAVDLAAERAMRAVLCERTPAIGFFGEEEGGDDPSQGQVWIADPIDGTINYATGSPLCGTML